MNENRTRLTHSTLERRRQMVEPADFFIKGSLTVSISGFILVKSSEMFSQGTLWLAVGFFMVLASISILSLGLTALASSASAFQALLSSDPPKRGFSELAKEMLFLVVCDPGRRHPHRSFPQHGVPNVAMNNPIRVRPRLAMTWQPNLCSKSASFNTDVSANAPERSCRSRHFTNSVPIAANTPLECRETPTVARCVLSALPTSTARGVLSSALVADRTIPVGRGTSGTCPLRACTGV